VEVYKNLHTFRITGLVTESISF